jgi:hypothetical protein
MPKAKNIRYSDIFTKEMIQLYMSDPCAFVEDILFTKEAKEYFGDLIISDQQAEILNSVVTNNRVSVRSGRSVGKTAGLAWLIIWFMCTRPKARVICTAPTFRQLNDILWPEVVKWLRCSVVKDIFGVSSKRIYLIEDPKSWFATAVTSSTPESFQGFHEDHLLLVMDEASGIKDEIWRTVRGSVTREDNLVVLTGNPTQTAGFFYDSHNKLQELWKTHHFSSEDSPFMEKSVIAEYKISYGEEHPIYQVHIKGNFPEGNTDSFISLQAVEAATMRDIEGSGQIQIGVDVAHYGDDLTVLAARHGDRVFDLITKDKTSIPEVTAMTLSLVKKMRAETGNKETIKVCVDATGVGAGVADELALDRDNNIEVVPINFGSAGNDRYDNMATVLWANIRDNIDKIQLPCDVKLIAELSNRKFNITKTGKIQIQSKKEYKKEFEKSPDRADAVILAFAEVDNSRRLVKDFDHLNPAYVSDISLRGYLTGAIKLLSCFYSEDRRYSCLQANWVGNRLYVTDELVSDNTVHEIVRWLSFKNVMNTKNIGNKRMFGTYGEDVCSQFRRFNLPIYENYRYDEYGAIELLNLLVNQKRITVHKACTALISQLRKWSAVSNRKQSEAEFGMCYALLNIVSELKDKIDPPTQSYQYVAYTGERERLLENVINSAKADQNKWQDF